jgi:hypothetical protein
VLIHRRELPEAAIDIRQTMKSENRQPFAVRSYIKKWNSSDLAQIRAGERPPRSAKLVADLDMGSSPGGGDFRMAWVTCVRFEAIRPSSTRQWFFSFFW